MSQQNWSRRKFIGHSVFYGAALSGLGGVLRTAPAGAAPAASGAPVSAWGLQIGDVTGDRAVIWSRADRNSTMVVEYSTNEHFRGRVRSVAQSVTDATDFTGRVDLDGLPCDSDVFVRVHFEGARHANGEALLGRFRTPPTRRRDIRFVWSGDTAGQGWGINVDFGGMKIYESMRRVQPDFFIHSGDNIYADGPMLPEVQDASGNVIWTNDFLDAVPEKLKVAETLNEYRRAYLYNHYDANLRAFNAEVPQIWQWDDHETINNWSPSKRLDSRYTTTDIQVLVKNSHQAFLEYSPIRLQSGDALGRIYRHIPYGEDLDVFVLDMRGYRAGNGCNAETAPGPATAYLGSEQIDWLKKKLRQSRATWKIIASDMPLGIIVGDGTDPVSGCAKFENSSNGDGPVLGREFEIAEILSFIKHAGVDNVVWLTADVHYCAANYYDPTAAVFQDFNPFWEFVAGPLNAGTFGPNAMDNTFGPTVIFEKVPPAGQSNLAPSAGYQFFGQIDIDHRSKRMTVALKDIDGNELFAQELSPGKCW